MLFDSVGDGAYGTAAANDRAWPLGGVPCATAPMERAGRRRALISVPLKFILLHRVLGVEPTQYRKTLYYMILVFMTQSSCTEGSTCQDRCRRDFSIRLLHARTLGSLSARFFILCLLYHQGTHSCRPPATSRMQGPPHSTLYCSFPRCILTDMKPRFTSRACPKHNHIEHTYAASEYKI
jgi:hypothetical protein